VLDVLRPGVLSGLNVCVAGGGDVIVARVTSLGATAVRLASDPGDEDAVAGEVGALGAIDVLVVDAATPFAAAGAGMAGLRRAVDGGWNAVRAVVNARWAGDGEPGGKVVFVAPHAAAGEHAEAVGAALENAARTLSIEWARFGIRTTAVLPRAGAGTAEVTELVAFLASPAGDYFTGCAFAPGPVAAVAR
jgi:NAD(P)-dependent dehydrogenase (short-subunit alcohol dehydrogenase family)